MSICRAKNPETCRYHRPNAGVVAHNNVVIAETRFNTAVTFAEKEQAAQELNVVNDIYDATDEGYQALRKETRETSTNGDWVAYSKATYRLMKAKIVRAEERQEGIATDVHVFSPDDMSKKLDDVRILVGAGGSDRFYDVYDKHEQYIRNAIGAKDSYSFTRTYNALVTDLLRENEGLNWFNAENGNKWANDVRNSKITGRVFRSLIDIENPTASTVFEI